MNTFGSKKYGDSGAAEMTGSGIDHWASIVAHRTLASLA
jgi:hypothetical protein